MMTWNQTNIFKVLERTNSLELLRKGQHGLERETLRVNEDGSLALTPHPQSLSDPMTAPHITTDFSDSQLELVTEPHDSIEEVLEALKGIHQRVLKGLKNDEQLWPGSMPCILPDSNLIPIARYGDGDAAEQKEVYRRGLARRYGKYIQMLCGVHYNVSFNDELWLELHQAFGEGVDLQDFKNQRSLALVRNFIRQRWLLAYLTGATPFKHKSYHCKSMPCDKEQNTIALRLSRCGYHNPEEVPICYNGFESHIASVDKAVATPHPPYTALGLEKNGERVQLNDHLFQLPNEYYFPIRMKPKPHADGFLEGLRESGVLYLELRLLDVDPHSAIGVDEQSLRLSHLFMLHCWLNESPDLSACDHKAADEDQEFVAVHGRTELPKRYQTEGLAILKSMQTLASHLGAEYVKTLAYFTDQFEYSTSLPWQRMLDEMYAGNHNFIEHHLAKAQTHVSTLKND